MSCPVAMPGILSSIWTSLRILEISGILKYCGEIQSIFLFMVISGMSSLWSICSRHTNRMLWSILPQKAMLTVRSSIPRRSCVLMCLEHAPCYALRRHGGRNVPPPTGLPSVFSMSPLMRYSVRCIPEIRHLPKTPPTVRTVPIPPPRPPATTLSGHFTKPMVSLR